MIVFRAVSIFYRPVEIRGFNSVYTQNLWDVRSGDKLTDSFCGLLSRANQSFAARADGGSPPKQLSVPKNTKFITLDISGFFINQSCVLPLLNCVTALLSRFIQNVKWMERGLRSVATQHNTTFTTFTWSVFRCLVTIYG